MAIKNLVKDNWFYFIKYSLVGVSGTILDLGIFTALITFTGLGSTLFLRGIATTLSFAVAVTNNFVWNKTWTFKDKDPNIKKQFAKFFLVSTGGLFLNTIFFTIFSFGLAHLQELAPDALTTKFSIVAKLGAIGIVAFYNFTMNRFWTFSPE